MKLLIEPSTSNVKPFDIGVYTFRRILQGSICPKDDLLATNGQVFAVLHPLQNVDPDGLYCFAVDRSDGNIKTILKKNLQFRKVVTLNYEKEPLMSYVQEVHAKLNTAIKYILENSKQLSL